MGLDSVELVLATEKEFGITIDDRDAASLTTPGKLADYVFSRLDQAGNAPASCLSQAGFYRVRTALITHFGARRSDIRPETPIRHFIHRNPARQWRILQQAIGAEALPKLRCKKPIERGLTWGLPLLAGSLAFQLNLAAPALLGMIALAWLIAQLACNSLASELPATPATLGALAAYVRLPPPTRWHYLEVLERVRQITAEQLAIPIEQIRPESRFVEDLGID